jgi:hypothetical protein
MPDGHVTQMHTLDEEQNRSVRTVSGRPLPYNPNKTQVPRCFGSTRLRCNNMVHHCPCCVAYCIADIQQWHCATHVQLHQVISQSTWRVLFQANNPFKSPQHSCLYSGSRSAERAAPRLMRAMSSSLRSPASSTSFNARLQSISSANGCYSLQLKTMIKGAQLAFT